MKILPFLWGCLFFVTTGANAQSQDSPHHLWINLGTYTHHFQQNRNLNNENTGFGLEWTYNEMYSLTGGIFKNSENQTSHYLGLYVTPIQVASARLGVVVGGFDGYPNAFNGNWFPALLPVAKFEGKKWGLNVTYIPTLPNRLYGGVSFQIKYAIY
ncbi:MAG: hypothetical protein WCO80_06445 [Betaproteobacteria bacterium]|nr:hypothetical protein [Betaproteobacteria bacterium]